MFSFRFGDVVDRQQHERGEQPMIYRKLLSAMFTWRTMRQRGHTCYRVDTPLLLSVWFIVRKAYTDLSVSRTNNNVQQNKCPLVRQLSAAIESIVAFINIVRLQLIITNQVLFLTIAIFSILNYLAYYVCVSFECKSVPQL